MTRLEQIAARAGDLPALPHVAVRILHALAREDITAAALEKEISHDQALAARVLRLSNSAWYAQRGAVATLGRAILVLGFNAVRSIVLAACAESIYRGGRSSFKDKLLWEHSLATGLIARFAAERVRYGSPEEAFVGGLIHDIGKVVLDRNHPDTYLAVLQRVYNTGDAFVDVEREAFGFDHAEVGALVVAKWSFSPQLQEAVRWHHDPRQATESPTFAALVSLANSIAVKLEIGPEKRKDLDLASLDAAAMLGLDGERLDQLFAESRGRFEAEKDLFSTA
jgi:putative nucleotidyltransferase with HDIG domain